MSCYKQSNSCRHFDCLCCIYEWFQNYWDNCCPSVVLFMQAKVTLHCVSKNRTLKMDWHNFHQNVPVMNDFSQNASAFNCGLIAFEKLDIGWVPTARFLWQQSHHAGARHATWLNWRSDWLTSQLTANLPSLIELLTVEKMTPVCVKAKGQHFEQLL